MKISFKAVFMKYRNSQLSLFIKNHLAQNGVEFQPDHAGLTWIRQP
jgi:hypothetical protein